MPSATSSGEPARPAGMHRHQAFDPARRLNVGVDHAGAERVDANAFLGDFAGNADHHRVDRALGRGVPDAFAGAAQSRRHRRHHHDRAAFAAMLGRHAAHAGAQAQKRAEGIDVEHFADGLGLGLIEPRECPDDAGRMDEMRDGPEFAGACSNTRSMSASTPMSPCSATALPPEVLTAATTPAAALALL